MKKNIILLAAYTILSSSVWAQYNSSMTSKSKIDWTSRIFTTQINLDVTNTNMRLPSGRNSAESLIKIKTPGLVKDSLLTLFVDNQNYLGDIIVDETLSLEQITKIIENSKQTPALYTTDGNGVNTIKTIDVNTISRQLIKHKYPYTPEEPIDIVSSRPYSGIIIDARGALPIHGEYADSEVFPCFFPTIWDDQMNINLYNYPTISENPKVKSYCGHSENVVRICFSPDDNKLMTISGMDKSVILWSVNQD